MLVDKVLQEVFVAFEVVELVHEGGKADHGEALEGVEEKREEHFTAGFLLHISLQHVCFGFEIKTNSSPDTS